MAHSSVRNDSPVTNNKKLEDTASPTTPAVNETCEGVAPSSPAQGTESSVSGSEPDMTVSEEGEQVLQQLARQVEYYFSTSNLSKDTYVSTLRSLNDGYVPVSIIANFGKVRSLVPYDSINAVRKASAEYSDLLQVVQINTQTGKRLAMDESSSKNNDQVNTLEAVGPISGEPIPVSALALSESPQTSPKATPITPSIQNTVILRDVPSDIQEENIRQLFAFEKCPAVKDLHLDVANCWFVTLDTSSRDDMVHVMFSLRSKTYASGEPIKARLKPGVAMSRDSPTSIPIPMVSTQMMYQPQAPPTVAQSNRYYHNGGGRKNKKKKNAKNKHNNNGNNNKGKNGNGRRNGSGKQKKNNQDKSQQQQQQRQNSSASTTNSNGSRATPETLNGSKSTPSTPNVPPPTLGEEQFPALPTDDTMAEPTDSTKKIEVEKVPEVSPEHDLKRDQSDSGSTATTSTSSSASKLGGYAAALLKAAPKQQEVSRPVKVDEKKIIKKEVVVEDIQESGNEDSSDETPVVVTPPSWGGGRSFADVLKKEEALAAEAAAASEQTA